MPLLHPDTEPSDLLRGLQGAALVTQPFRFLRYETVSRGAARAMTYVLAQERSSITVRHGTVDVDLMGRVFGRHVRRSLPEPARRVLSDVSGRISILDLGAHTGMRALSLLSHYPGAQVTSVEPDPMNIVMLRRTIVANRMQNAWTVLNGAVGNGEYLRGPGYGRFAGITDAERRAVASPVDALGLMAGADLVSVNVQGAEWGMLRDEHFLHRAAPVLLLECHHRGCPESEPTTYAMSALRSNGFDVARINRRRNGEGMVCAWTRSPEEDRRRAPEYRLG